MKLVGAIFLAPIFIELLNISSAMSTFSSVNNRIRLKRNRLGNEDYLKQILRDSSVRKSDSHRQRRQVTTLDVDSILYLLNDMRRQFNASNMQYVKWDPQLQSFAQIWCRKCDIRAPVSRGQYVNQSLIGFYSREQLSLAEAVTRILYTDSADRDQLLFANVGAIGCSNSSCSSLSDNNGNVHQSMTLHACIIGFTSEPVMMNTDESSCSECPITHPRCEDRLCAEITTIDGGRTTSPVGPPGPAGPTTIDGGRLTTRAGVPGGPSGPATIDGGRSSPAGAIGPSGPEGPTGPVGPAGPTGPVGPAGPTGPVGPAGPTTQFAEQSSAMMTESAIAAGDESTPPSPTSDWVDWRPSMMPTQIFTSVNSYYEETTQYAPFWSTFAPPASSAAAAFSTRPGIRTTVTTTIAAETNTTATTTTTTTTTPTTTIKTISANTAMTIIMNTTTATTTATTTTTLAGAPTPPTSFPNTTRQATTTTTATTSAKTRSSLATAKGISTSTITTTTEDNKNSKWNCISPQDSGCTVQTNDASSGSGNSKFKTIIGIVFGVICGVILVFILIFFVSYHIVVYRRRKNLERRREQNSPNSTLRQTSFTHHTERVYSISHRIASFPIIKPPPYSSVNPYHFPPPSYSEIYSNHESDRNESSTGRRFSRARRGSNVTSSGRGEGRNPPPEYRRSDIELDELDLSQYRMRDEEEGPSVRSQRSSSEETLPVLTDTSIRHVCEINQPNSVETESSVGPNQSTSEEERSHVSLQRSPDTIGPDLNLSPDTFDPDLNLSPDNNSPGTISPDNNSPDAIGPDSPDGIGPDTISLDTISHDNIRSGTTNPDTTNPDTISSDNGSVDIISPDTISLDTVHPDSRSRARSRDEDDDSQKSRDISIKQARDTERLEDHTTDERQSNPDTRTNDNTTTSTADR